MRIITLIHQSSLAAALMFVVFYGLMLAGAALLQRNSAIAAATSRAQGRDIALDGLRGVLAYGVMAHHSITAYVYFATGVWAWSQNPVLNQLGQATVALFFMITGFLFTRKALAPRLDWLALYRARLMRLTPLYALVVAVLFAVVLALSGFHLQVPPLQLLQQFGHWLAFAAFDRPDINGLPNSWTLIAGVNWTLRYEWAFYLFAVPALHLLARALPRALMLAAALSAMAGVAALMAIQGPWEGNPVHISHFLCGITAALIHDTPRGRALMASPLVRAATGPCLLMLGVSLTAGTAPAFLATFVLFLAVAGGFTLFGLLASRAAVWLGDISYGVYLIHGLVLWLTLYACRAAGWLGALDAGLGLILGPLLGWTVMILASLSCLWLERPALALSRAVPTTPRA